ncbi:pyridoxamine 5'-phosphate oxidase family protein [uncultured Algibacter sp.]|uniref:pyridoxamine 5'-phosphate oxidase family protein n=1 Tax=uncultured Algibacter sp. TaxID=298659 RepID=UPI002631869C|nr:pyridoxamine 5'-phosphate oxidase family protein [uncultured Algibacter sp.]
MIINLDKKESLYLLSHNYIGYISYISQNRPFVVPITYFFDSSNNTLICYSGEGHKISAMRQNNFVSLCVTDINTSSNWKSVLVHGSYSELSGSNAKTHLHEFSLGIKDIIRKKEKMNVDFISEFSSKIYNGENSIVFLIKIEDIIGKKRRFEKIN